MFFIYRYERTACYRDLTLKETADHVSITSGEDDTENR